MAKKLRLVLGDQLNYQHSWFQNVDAEVLYLIMEMRQETDYVDHHIQKVMGFFAAMRAFAEWLESNEHRVYYLSINDKNNQQDLTSNLKQVIDEHDIEKFEFLLPDEYRLDQQLSEFCDEISISFEAVDSEHFLTSRNELAEFFDGKKTYVMENFYRRMRKKHDVLMQDGEPVSGKWNHDESNREKLPKQPKLPKRIGFDKDLTRLKKEIEAAQIKTIGRTDAKHFRWPTSRSEALEALSHFLEDCLSDFGTYQDAMHSEHRFLNHSLLSFALNTKMLSPREVIEAAVDYWQAHQDAVDIAQVEGFVRQILGWREFMRGVYWAKMPEYAQLNSLGHERKLPSWYWTGDTKMNCLHHAITQSLETAYAHHIQRLMVTGNFALLAGIHPDELDKWYLGIYIDAIEWVEITNTRGMSQFADGGIVGTKPYVSSANYINKMSNYCQDCHYSKSKKVGDNACPFNSLYWHFYARHEDKFAKNPRIGMMYRTLERMNDTDKILDQAEHYLEGIESL